MTFGTLDEVYFAMAHVIDACGGDVVSMLIVGTDYAAIERRIRSELERLGSPVRLYHGMEIVEAYRTIAEWAGCIEHDDCRANRDLARVCAGFAK